MDGPTKYTCDRCRVSRSAAQCRSICTQNRGTARSARLPLLGHGRGVLLSVSRMQSGPRCLLGGDVQRPSATPRNDPVTPVISNDPVIPVISTLTNDPVIPVISENSNRTIVPVVSRPLTRLPVFTPDAWAARVAAITLPVWLPPSELRYPETRWLPHIG